MYSVVYRSSRAAYIPRQLVIVGYITVAMLTERFLKFCHSAAMKEGRLGQVKDRLLVEREKDRERDRQSLVYVSIINHQSVYNYYTKTLYTRTQYLYMYLLITRIL